MSSRPGAYSIAFVGSGRSGDVFRVRGAMIDRVMVSAMTRDEAHARDVVLSPPMPRSPVSASANNVDIAVKMQILADETCERDVVIEDRVQLRVSHAKVRMRRSDDTVVTASAAPAFIVGATLQIPASVISMPVKTTWRVSVMEMIRGKTLTVMDGSAPVEAHRVYGNVESALVTLWGCGVAHADLHPWNIMVMSDHTVRFIDFGLAITMRRDALSKLRTALRSIRDHRAACALGVPLENAPPIWSSVDRAFDAFCLPHLKRVMAGRGIAWQNCHFDGERLRNLRHALPSLQPPLSRNATDRAPSPASQIQIVLLGLHPSPSIMEHLSYTNSDGSPMTPRRTAPNR
jgi:tRNA A-37 threonylcarbamoyl transferase component Bud32